MITLITLYIFMSAGMVAIQWWFGKMTPQEYFAIPAYTRIGLRFLPLILAVLIWLFIGLLRQP